MDVNRIPVHKTFLLLFRNLNTCKCRVYLSEERFWSDRCARCETGDDYIPELDVIVRKSGRYSLPISCERYFDFDPVAL